MLSACEKTADERQDKILSFFKNNKYGDKSDYGLFSTGLIYKGNYLIGTVNGVADNSSTCQEIADLFNKKEPNTYYCRPLN